MVQKLSQKLVDSAQRGNAAQAHRNPLQSFHNHSNLENIDSFCLTLIRGLHQAIKSILRDTFTTDYLVNTLLRGGTKWQQFARAVHKFEYQMTILMNRGKKGRRSVFDLRKDVFDNPYMRIVYFHFCEAVFCCEPKEMCKRMRILCCSDRKHQKTCKDKWARLKQFAQIDSIEALDLEPFLIEENPS